MLAVFGWIIFRAPSIVDAWEYICGMCNSSLLSIPFLHNRYFYIPLFTCLILMLATEWINRDKSHPFDLEKVESHIVKYAIYFVIITLIIFFTPATPSLFIYFQF